MKNEVRPIDANALARKIREYMDNFPYAGTRLATCRVVLSMLGDEGQTPTVKCDYNATEMRHGLNKPLTIEQLRKMDGQPVWVKVIDHTVFADKEDDFDGWGMCRKSWVRIWDSKRADIVHIDYDFEDYEKEWLAYAYPTAHIDREAWTAEWKEYTGADAGFHYCSKCGQQAFNYENGGEVVEVLSEFCPSCGKAMTPDAWAELEKRLT